MHASGIVLDSYYTCSGEYSRFAATWHGLLRMMLIAFVIIYRLECYFSVMILSSRRHDCEFNLEFLIVWCGQMVPEYHNYLPANITARKLTTSRQPNMQHGELSLDEISKRT